MMKRYKAKVRYYKSIEEMDTDILLRTYKKLSRAVRDPRLMCTPIMDTFKEVCNILITRKYGNGLQRAAEC